MSASIPPRPILIGLGGNLPSPRWGAPRQTLTAALTALAAEGVTVSARSSWYRSEPVPHSDQPWFTNAVAALQTGLDANALLGLMQAIESQFGRVRGVPNAARIIDLDLLDFRGERRQSAALTLPHPRLHRRRFVLEPLAEIMPIWRHPLLGKTAQQLLAALAAEEQVERLPC